MILFTACAVFYFLAIGVLLFFIHRESEKFVRDRTAIPESGLLEQRWHARNARMRGLSAADNYQKTGNMKAGWLLSLLVLLYMAAATAAPIVVGYIIKNSFIPKGYSAVKADVFALLPLAAGAFGFCCITFLPMSSAKLNRRIEMRFGSEKMKEFSSFATSARICKIVVLFAFIITFPFFSLSLNTYACYNEQEIKYCSFFSVSETVTEYSQVRSVERYFHRDNNGEISSMHYQITLADGKILDTLFGSGDYVGQTYELHTRIKSAQPWLFEEVCKEPLEDIRAFLNDYGAATYEKVLFIFDLI